MMTLLLLLGFAVGFGQPDAAVQAKAIERAKNTVVHDIDPALPRLSLAKWLANLSPGAETGWEVNDCGEQTGNPGIDRGRDFPMCVEADVRLGDQRRLYVSLAVGTFKKGPAPGPPRFHHASVADRGNPIKWVQKLADVPSAVRTDGGR